MNRSPLSFLLAVFLATAALCPWVEHAKAQEIGLTPMQTTEVARGYRASALQLQQVVNDKGEKIGRINDFIFGKDGNERCPCRG